MSETHGPMLKAGMKHKSNSHILLKHSSDTLNVTQTDKRSQMLSIQNDTSSSAVHTQSMFLALSATFKKS